MSTCLTYPLDRGGMALGANHVSLTMCVHLYLLSDNPPLNFLVVFDPSLSDLLVSHIYLI